MQVRQQAGQVDETEEADEAGVAQRQPREDAERERARLPAARVAGSALVSAHGRTVADHGIRRWRLQHPRFGVSGGQVCAPAAASDEMPGTVYLAVMQVVVSVAGKDEMDLPAVGLDEFADEEVDAVEGLRILFRPGPAR